MTKQEAIYELSNIFAFGFYNDRVDEAVDMAIEALEQEPTAEYLSDVISRQAAIDALYDKGLSMTAWGELLAMKWSDIQTCIEQLPFAQPERPKGKWIATEYDTIKCGECGIVYSSALYPRKYCPNCGADMKEA